MEITEIKMNLMKDLTELKDGLSWLGFDITTGSYNLKVKIYLIIILTLAINGIMDFIINWKDIDIRVDAIKGLFIYLYFGLCLSEIAFNWRDIYTLINIIENRFHKYPFQKTQERKNLESSIEKNMIIINSIWYNGRPVYIGSEILPPLVVLIYRISTTNFREINVDTLFTTHRYYYPEEHEPLIVYFIALTLQTALYLYVVTVAYVILSSAFVPMYLIGGELQLLALTIEEMDSIIEDHTQNVFRKSRKTEEDYNKIHHTQSMKFFISHIVNHHQHIYRMVKQVNHGIQLVALFLNSGVTLLLVTAIYVMIQRDGLMGKLPEAVYSFFMVLILYFYNAMGQEVVVQNDNLRKALYQGQWMDKPLWFQKSIQIIMTRATKPMHMKPIGLFVLDLQNFLTLLKAIYTFYNLLNNFKDAAV